MRITDEQKEKAAFVNLPQFLMAHGFDLKKVGREYVWKDHDSLHIKDNGSGERGAWFRFSEDKGGDNIGLLREYMDMSFLDAVEALTGEHIDRTYTPSRTYESKPVQQTARELSLAEADNCRRVFAYLCKTRGLDYDMLSALVKEGTISQEEKTGNVLFKYYDDQGKVIGAEKVGTSTEHKFKGIATGSAGGHGFEVVHGTGEKAFFFESAIDMLSYLQMHSKELDNCRLVSMMGVKPSIVLDTMLRHNIAPENVFLCSDNDTAGNEFARRLQEHYPDMKRIITPDTYKDWNDMLRNIPKQIKVEQETKTKEVDSVADLMTYGNKMWNNATDNRDKSLISMQLADFQRVQEMLEKSGINYYAYEMNGTVRMAVNDKDTDWLRKILGNMNVTKSNRPYSPPEKNIIGNTEYRYIPQKEYVTADRDLVLKMADIMARRGMQFSGRIYPSGKGTLTVSHADFVAVRNIKDEVISMRKQFASPDKAQEVGNRDYCANRDTRYYMSKLTPEQFKEVKPFLETSVSYHAVVRDGKVAFAVDKENAPAFHRALENAVRETNMLRKMADLGLSMEQNIALSPVVHRLAVEDMQLDIADFFDSRYDEAQFGEMLSLVNAYIAQAPAERYGENSKLTDMLEAKSSFDRSIELSDFFSLHDFSDEQSAAITAMFVGDVTRGQFDSIDETFTAEDIQAYDEILHNALQESDVADFLTAHKQAVIDCENAERVLTEEEVLFPKADLARFLAERTLSSDEWEDMAYPLFDSGYLDKHKPSDKAAFGYHLSEPALYDLAQRFHDGEDIRRELALGLLEGSGTADIEFIFEQGEMSDRTYYYAENLRHSLHLEKTDEGYNCSFGGMERFISFEEIGQAFIDRIHEEYEDLAYWAVLDFIKDDIPDISDDTVKELISAFDGAALHGWENGDNVPKLNRIKKALFDVLGDEDQTEKAFACIAKHKYNVTFEAEKPEKQPDSLTFHFGKDKGDEWVSESDIVHDFALAHPDCSFALGNAVLEYLDEKQHSERDIPELKAGWYKKTDFSITAVIGGEEFNYDGRFDIGDGKGTGGGSLIDHIRTYNEGILGYTQHPFNQPEYKERAQRMLDIFVPFLEAHSELTAEEQHIFDDFKAQHPIRTYDDVEKAQGTFKIYQLPGGEKYHGVRFEGLDRLKADGVQLNHDDYELVYEGEVGEFRGKATLEALYTQFNTDHPEDFRGHSLSVSDVIVIHTDGKDTAYFCDSFGFTEMPEFFCEKELVQEKPETAKVSDLAVGDAILYEGKRREVEEISTDRIKMKDLDAPDYGGILLGTSDVLVYDGWQEDMESKDFEILSKAEKPVVEAPEQAESEDKGPVSLRKVGDFYEMYGKNAEIGEEVLGLRMLSKNGQPMVGFPDHVKDEYFAKLREAGYTVLIEQAFELNPPKREPEKLQTLQQVVDKFFGTDCESAETEGGTWKLAIVDGEKVGELFYGGDPVCGIYNRGDKMEIEPYRELTTFPALLRTAMLEHNPDKPVEIMDFQRTFETPLDKAKRLINDFCEAEYHEGADFDDLHNVGLAFTTLTDDELPIQVTADLIDFKITHEFDGEVFDTEQFDSIEDMIENGLTDLDFSDLVSVPDEVIERHTGKDEQTVELMSDAADAADISSPADDVPAVTLKYKGDAESLDEIKDKALSLGATVIVDNAEGIISIDTYADHTAELDTLAYELGVMAVDDVSAVETPAQETADIDKPLFTDAAVIDEIQRNENADVPFWEMPEAQGEQLSLFGDPEPLTASKPAPEKPKSEFAKGPVVDGVQVYEALAAEIDRGTGFVHGKLRVQDFYEEQHPTIQQLADSLKKEYGTGGHSGEGKISLVDYNSQGITFSFENGEKFRHSWYNVATMTESRLKDDTYLSAEQKAERAALKAEKAEEQSHKIVEVGDRFRHKITGEVSEVISLTGALPFYSDDCTVTRASSGFAVTENISYDKLLNSGMYDYIGKAEPEKEQSAPVKPEKAEVTPDKPDIPTVKNLSQLKKAIKPGMMFEITDHLRPECIGERRVVTGVTTVDFTSRKLDENGEPTGKDLHMEFDRAKNWTFDGGELTSRLDNGDMLMSFHFIDSLEREQTFQAEKELELAPSVDEVEAPAPEVIAPDKGENFMITDDALGEGGAKSKFRANVDAIKTLKTLEREKRPATAEKKETLSKYVGWGAISQAFDPNNDKWTAEYAELKNLLTPQEYAQARSTVNDAFYTRCVVMKRVFSAFVAWIMIFITSISALPVSAAGSSAEYIKYVVPFISDQTKQTQVCGLSNESLLKDGVVLIPLETACEIAGATIKAETDEAVIASRNYVSWCCNYNEHKKQYLLVDWHTGKGDYYAAALNCLKGSWTGLASFKYCFDGNAGISLPVDDVYNTDITYDLYQGTLYVSFYEFLDMMGVKVDVITHERVNAIIDLYDNVINAFSNAKNRNDADTIKKIFKDRVGYEQFFFCVLGTPIDALYQRYYDNHLQFKIDNYYSKNTVEWANLVNAVGNYEGLTKTAMAALNLNCDYEDALINVVKYHGSSANEDTTKVSSVIDVVQRMLVFADGAQNIKEICSDSNLSVSWDIQQKVNKQKPILSDGMGSKGQAVKASMTCISAFCCAAENYSKFKGLENLFLDEQYLLQNSILSSESFLDDVYEENKIDIDSTLGMLIPNFKTAKDIIDNLKNTSNSYFNLYHSASKVQLIMDTSSPAAYSAVLGAIEDVAYSLADDALMSMIDAAFFGGAPVSSLVNDRVMFSVYHLKDGVYGKKSASISELDDYAFLQLVAKDCFREYDLESENAYSSFLLGLKATMLAYRSASIDANGDPNGEIPKELSDIYNQSCFASMDIYDASPGKCSNLTDVLGNNINISMVDTVPHQGLTLEFQSGDNIKRGVYESDNIKVIVSDESNSKCKIRIEQVHGFSERGVYYYSGPLSEEIDFEGNDGNSNNAYHIVFDVDSLHLTIRQLYITNEVSGWEFSNVDETLHFSTDVIPNYDISSWTNDMIAEAINNYLQYLQGIGEWSGYYVLSSEINEDEKMVPIRSRTGQSEHDYVAHWKWGEDYACVGIAYSDVTTDIFHMSEYYDEKEHYLRSAIEERGTLAVWEYADYDGNGEKEAFAITTTEDDEIKAVYFVDSNCNVSVMQTSFDGLCYYESGEGYYRMHAGKGFFWCNYGAHGSGYHTMLYSVKDGTPYALDIASQLQGFYQDGESLYTIEDSFDAGYHQWFKKELVYDSSTQQFRKGRVLGELN